MPDEKTENIAMPAQRADLEVALVHVRDEKTGTLYYGADQGWFDETVAEGRRSVESFSGCGVVSAADLLATAARGDAALAARLDLAFNDDGTLSRAQMLALMGRCYARMGTLEVPVAARRYRLGRLDYENKEKRARESRNALGAQKKARAPIPPSLGVWGARYQRGVIRLFAAAGIPLRARALLTQYRGYGEGLAFLRASLENGRAVDLFTTMNGHEMALYAPGDAARTGRSRTARNIRHHVVVTGLLEDSGGEGPRLIASTWGQPAVISYRALHASWQRPGAVASGMFTFEPATPGQARRSRLRALFYLLPAAARAVFAKKKA